ncbi:MAG: hypothetical protein IJE45_02810 [Bacilli bacterium]|nr:hypothetical protein [Bacilli bacterium]
MKNSEYNFFEEVRKTQENQNYQAIQYSVVEKESYLQKNETLLSEEFGHTKTKTNKAKENNSIVKKLIQKVIEATSSFMGGIAATAVVAVSSIVLFTNILVKEPVVELIDIIVGQDYVMYNLLLDDISDNMDYYTIISNDYESYKYELIEGENLNTLYNLELNTEYNLFVIGINNNNEEIKYFDTTFSTLNKIKVKWVVENNVVEEDEIEYGTIPIYDGLTPSKEATNDEEYEFIGWDKEISSAIEDITYTAIFKANIYEYTATFNQLSPDDIVIEYGTNSNVMTFNTNFNNNGDERLKYRIYLIDKETSEKYIYDGSEEIAVIDVPSNLTVFNISYELYGIYNGAQKVFETINVNDPLVISVITSDISDLILADTNKYQLSLLINSDFEEEEIYNSVNLLITYDDLTTSNIIIKDVLVNEKMNFEVLVPSYCKSFEIDYTIDLLGANGNNPRTITSSKEFTLENSYELIETQVETQDYSITRFLFKYHFIDENTTLAVKNAATGTVIMLYEGENNIQIELNASTNVQEYTYYLSNINGEAIGEENAVSFEIQDVKGDYNFQYINPGDAIVTFNDDDTMNIYLDTVFETEDSSIYYVVRYTNYKDGTVYNIKYTESVAYLEDVPFSNYGIEYFVFKTVNGLEYQLQNIAVSGGIEITLDGVLQSTLGTDNYGNPYVSIMYYDYYNLSNFVLIADDKKIPIPSSNIVFNNGYCEIEYQLDFIPSKLVLEYEAMFNDEITYESISSIREIKGEQYRKMYLEII